VSMFASDTTRSSTKSNTSSEDSSQRDDTGKETNVLLHLMILWNSEIYRAIAGESSSTPQSDANSQMIGGALENLTATTGIPAETSEEILPLLTQKNVVGKE
jgi:hypothetical protein